MYLIRKKYKIYYVILLLNYIWEEQISITSYKYLKTPICSENVKKYKYKKLKQLFEESGFTNVKVEKLVDLDTNNLDNNKKVESVTIGKKTSYDETSRFFENTQIVIKYHSPIEMEIPSYDGKNYNDYISQLKTLGFNEIEVEKHEESYPYENEEVYKVKTSNKVIYSGDKIPIDTKIIVQYCTVAQDSNNTDTAESTETTTNTGGADDFLD